MPNPSPNTCPGGVSPLDTLTRLIDLYDGCARAGILSDLGRADRANLEALRAVWAAMPTPSEIFQAAGAAFVFDPTFADTWTKLTDLGYALAEAFGPNSAPNP